MAVVEEKYLTNNETCKLWGISKQTLSNWTEEGLPQFKRGKYPLFAVAEWIRKNKLDSSESLSEWKRKKIQAEAQLKQIEVMLKEGEIIPAKNVMKQLLDRLIIFKRILMFIPRQLCPNCSKICDERIREALNQYASKTGVFKEK